MMAHFSFDYVAKIRSDPFSILFLLFIIFFSVEKLFGHIPTVLRGINGTSFRVQQIK